MTPCCSGAWVSNPSGHSRILIFFADLTMRHVPLAVLGFHPILPGWHEHHLIW